MSQFFLQNEEQYCYHPKLAKYFVPLTNAKFQDYLDGRKRSIKLMCRSSEFNQDKTTLIVTNNPLPDLNSSHRKDTPMKFFCKEHLGRGIDARSQLHLPPLKTQQNQLTGPGTCFAEGNVGRSLQFSRFSTDTDFKTEGQFSKSYAERRLLKLYPHLHFQAFPRLDTKGVRSLPRKNSKPTRETSCQWEPLTLSSLFEAKPIVNVPGENSFKHGKVSQWVVSSSFVDSSK
ncbi:testis-specific gene 13 protein isoform X3 [Mauremys reevesii]|uniref:testis-specific gene 13 protein isoform X3 n=1 Tax=Mauremys reevesii TaxID=260615 RepID=UPI00194000D6|nr:testis-specific gene 13 protein isoform X3 [Mauremys reevesii]XP_039375751.1 testis-specific gene 13 protein isoform X3 [Mauremys reevesii]XP_039375752.1 testis-specific gene 13 protein isoform X3 [Mauremys reevesii]XP_039375753.1 testis-specific gene 13 protein isoform X3 [Mauremys reevesii]XP_039375754.1 testis-specific gene 13 protein isoform X3 [Mauremys reevesii]XP_039375755.1 testis-specific gene 13 protein isoform X3 [Mauremys reevesii]